MTIAFYAMLPMSNGGAGAGGAAVSSVEFNTLENCKKAGQQWQNTLNGYTYEVKKNAKWFCVEK